MIKFFVVNHLGSDYNDEVYDLQEGGTPVRVFKDKRAADEFARLAHGDELADIQFQSWGYSVDEITSLDSSEFTKRVNEILGTEFSDAFEECYVGDYELSREQKDQLVELVDKLKFYVVEEVEGG